MTEPRITVPAIRARKGAEKIAVLTAYDAPTARLLDGAGIDVILVGDSVGNVVLGYENTLPVSMEEMLHHFKAVRRGASRAMVVADMPFLSYQASISEAVHNAGLFVKAGADAVKLEGGLEMVDTVARLVELGIPVMGHVGLTPQKVNQYGGFRAQGRNAQTAFLIYRSAMAIERAGAFSIVLESVPHAVAGMITAACPVPVIGIGAGPDCDGQVLVFNDLVGLTAAPPKFAKAYAKGLELFANAAREFARDVRGGAFPSPSGGPEILPAELEELAKMTGGIPKR